MQKHSHPTGSTAAFWLHFAGALVLALGGFAVAYVKRDPKIFGVELSNASLVMWGYALGMLSARWELCSNPRP